MRTLSLVILVAALAGCKEKQANQDKPKAPDCVTAISPIRSMPHGPPAERLSLYETRCTIDSWSDAARTCIAAATTVDALATCLADHLTADQKAKLEPVAKQEPSLNETTPEEMDQRLNDLERIANAMCACRDTACTQRVSADLDKFSKGVARFGTRAPKFSNEAQARAAEISQRMSDCARAAQKADAPPPAPPHPTVAKKRELKERICACRDRLCADNATVELKAWAEQQKAAPVDPDAKREEPTSNEQAELAVMDKEIDLCLQKIRSQK